MLRGAVAPFSLSIEEEIALDVVGKITHHPRHMTPPSTGRLVRLYAFALVILAGIGCLDYFLPYEVSFLAFYFIPISIVAVKCGRRWGIQMALLAALCWIGVSYFERPPRVSITIFLWNGVMRIVAFYIFAIAMSRMGSEIRNLRDLLPICSSCKKVRDDQGYWEQVEHYLEKHVPTRFAHGLCPDCSEKFIQPNVLLVQDEAELFFKLKNSLAKVSAPHSLRAVDSVDRAMDWLLGADSYIDRARFPLPDVLIINARATRGAFRLLSWLREHNDFRKLPVLIIGESGNREHLSNAYALGADAFFIESDDYADVAEFLQAARG